MLAGMHVLQYVGLIDALMAFDFGMALIDNEIALVLKRMARGIEMSEGHLALEEIAQVGLGGMFITAPRTLEFMASCALLPEIADRQTREEWTLRGAVDAQTRALKRAREILSKSSDSLFSPEVDQRIRDKFTGLVPGDSQLPVDR
jgi:trimethylamine--corrinoid protein Co-methyltransferase